MPMNKILIVDDSPAHLENLKQAVYDSGAKISLATSGKQALDIAKEEMPDLIFMDVVMEDVDGYQACRELSKDEITKDIPVVFVTTKNNRADKIWAEKQGGRHFISKPFMRAEIEEQIRRFS